MNMVADVGFDDWFPMPGGGGFVEITDMFIEGSRDMEAGEVLLMEGYTLIDAMSAFEIGEPRLDSGMILEEQLRPPFDPLEPLLPEEVCWLLDRSFACEMEWHTGKTLSQSVYTILFVHQLPEINPDYLPPEEEADPSRPRGLITVVLRAGMLGLVKCCELALRELSKNRLHEVEDWQAEKCDISVLEGILQAIPEANDVDPLIDILDAAYSWIRQSNLSEDHVAALCDRLLLRKTLLQFFSLDLHHEIRELWYNLPNARGLVHKVRVSHHEDLPSDSPAHLAVDKHIARHLPNFMPIRVAELPPPEKSWDALDALFEYWGEITKLLSSPSLMKWEVAEALRTALNRKLPVAFHRSLMQSLFFDEGVVLGNQRSTWLVEQFYHETLGLPYSTISQCLAQCRPQGHHSVTQDVTERRIVKLMVPHVRSSWYNPPRRRRHLMKEVLQWHTLYDMMLKEVGKRKPPDSESAATLKAIPYAAQLWRLTASREIILTGFQQELYAREEIPIAYWYLCRVLDVHLGCIENLLPVIPSGTSAYLELKFQADHLAALQIISTALIVLTAGYITSPWSRLSLNCRRRYKWAFYPEFKKLAPAEPLPNFESLQQVLEELLGDELYSPSAQLQLAQTILSRLSESSFDWIGRWEGDRKQYLRNLVDVCDRLKRSAPSRTIELPNYNAGNLKWIPDVHPWFPTIS